MNPIHSLLRTHLRQRVADTFGTALTYPHEAKVLAAEVLRRTSERLLSSTLKWLFGLVTAFALPAPPTPPYSPTAFFSKSGA